MHETPLNSLTRPSNALATPSYKLYMQKIRRINSDGAFSII